MAKSKGHSSELEHLRQQVRTLKSVVRNLKKELARCNKNVYIPDYTSEEDELAKKFEARIKLCPECIRGQLLTTSLGARKLIACQQCGYRKIEK